MNYQNDHTEDFPEQDPWDRGVYRTGSTKPPKSHGGLIAILLVAVILLSGIVTVLGVMNIRLFRQLNSIQEDKTLPIVFHQTTEPEDPSLTTIAPSYIPEETRAVKENTVSINSSPISSDNKSQPDALSLQEIYRNTIPSVVSISSTERKGTSTGTGVIISQEGYIVTNYHVVDSSETLSVFLSDGRTLEAAIVGTDEVTDIAVLHIIADDLVPAEFGDSSVLQVGDKVVAIGDPLGIELRGTMTDGIISAINRDIDVGGRTMSLIQTNAALNSGNSGGPLINCYGQVIGINTMKMGDSMSSAGVEGLGFAIPSTTIVDIVNQLISQGFVSGRPDIGLSGEGISSFYQFYYYLPRGLHVTEITEGGSADQAGIEEGDIILSIDGHSITDMDVLKTVVYSYDPGDVVQVIVYRDGKQYNANLTVGEATGE